MPISSETLFHFTPKPEYLFQILEYNFRPRYYQEIIKLKGLKSDFIRAIPMVCFCDIPLSQIKNHIATYGCYGIGMSKSWAIKNKLNPILYIEPNSKLTKSIISILKNAGDIDKNDKKEGIFNLFRYMKNYKGDFYRNGLIIKNVNFYNEREWRYLPDTNSNIKFWLSEEEFGKPINLVSHNREAENDSLKFQPEDIRYIIIKDETEIPTMISTLKSIKSKYTDDVIEKLVSRIITTEQINEDF